MKEVEAENYLTYPRLQEREMEEIKAKIIL
jgi:hypothetical protein